MGQLFSWGNSLFPLEFDSYEAQSPTLGKIIKFNDQEIWDELDRIILEDKERKFTIGQNLWYNITFFCNPQYFYDAEISRYIEDFFVSTKYNEQPTYSKNAL